MGDVNTDIVTNLGTSRRLHHSGAVRSTLWAVFADLVYLRRARGRLPDIVLFRTFSALRMRLIYP